MATTNNIIDAVVQRLRAKLPSLAAEFFPEKPADYRLNHPRGALLVSYAGSTFDKTADVAYVAQPRNLRFTVNIVMRQLNGRDGAVAACDQVRGALLGWVPPDCRKVWTNEEKYLGERAGLWQYALTFATQGVVIEDADVDTDAPLTGIASDGATEDELEQA
jgi:hypothetical protein